MAIGWLRFRADNTNTGFKDLVGVTNPRQNWLFSPSSVGVLSNVVVGTDSYMRFIGTDLKLYKLSADGTQYSSVSPDAGLNSSSYVFNSKSAIVLDENNNVYVTIPNGIIQKFDSNLVYQYSSTLKIADSQPSNGVSFLSSGNIVALSSTGLRPAYIDMYNSTDMSQVGSALSLFGKGLTGVYHYTLMTPAVYNDYMAFVISGSADITDVAAKLVVIQIPSTTNLDTTVIKWQDFGYRAGSAPAIDSNGYLYAIRNDKTISRRAVMYDGNPVVGQSGNWDYVLNDGVDGYMAPSIDSNNNVYIIDRSNKLYSIDQYGTLNYPMVSLNNFSGSVQIPIVIDRENNLYIAQGDKVVKYDTTSHKIKWEYQTSGNIVGQPVLVENGGMYVPTDGGMDAIENVVSVFVKGYNIYRSNSPTTGFVKINKTPVVDAVYDDVSLEDGVYYYMVKAVSVMNIESQEANVIGPFTVNVVPPGKSKNLNFTSVDDAIVLTWDPPLYNVDGTTMNDLLGYDVYRIIIPATSLSTQTGASINTDLFSGFTAANRVSKSIVVEPTYTDRDVTPGYYYFYSVRARDIRGNSGPYADEIRAALNIYKMILVNGINVIGFPFKDPTMCDSEGNMTIASFIDKIGSNKVKKFLRWNKIAQSYEQYPNFTNVDSTEGYIVVLDIGKDALEMDIIGTKWDEPKVALKAKDNLINLPLKDYTKVSQLVSALGGVGNVKSICRYNQTTNKYEQYVPELNKGDFTELEAGYGYFVYLTSGLTDKQLSFSGTAWF